MLTSSGQGYESVCVVWPQAQQAPGTEQPPSTPPYLVLPRMPPIWLLTPPPSKTHLRVTPFGQPSLVASYAHG